MASTNQSPAAAVCARVSHPIIDSDGHAVEFGRALFDCVTEVGGRTTVDRLRRQMPASFGGFTQPRGDRSRWRGPWWALPAENTLDLATATLPKLLYERLDEIGLDFTVLYPSMGLVFPELDDEEVRRAACRGANLYFARYFGEFRDRMAPVASVPMHTPAEAIEELEYAVREMGFKAVVMPSFVRRPITTAAAENSEAGRSGYWIDTFCLDSEYDYDLVWAKCVELGIAPTFHSLSMGIGFCASPSNYMYNHIGHFAASGEALCKALFMGGVTRRFPTLKFAFLEGGVGWAAGLYAELIGHWEKRNVQSVQRYNPARMDRELFLSLCQRYGGELTEHRLETRSFLLPVPDQGADLQNRDDWSHCGINSAEDIRDLFVPHFYFGCEADDPMNATAFDTRRNPFGARLNAIFSSDIGHWDVPDMREVTHEAYELVDDGLISEEDFRRFVFENPGRMWMGMNPDFFNGTKLENAVRTLNEQDQT